MTFTLPKNKMMTSLLALCLLLGFSVSILQGKIDYQRNFRMLDWKMTFFCDSTVSGAPSGIVSSLDGKSLTTLTIQLLKKQMCMYNFFF